MSVNEEVIHRIEQLYKQFVIQVLALPVRTGGFTAHLNIHKDGRSYFDDTPVHTGKVFATENEAAYL